MNNTLFSFYANVFGFVSGGISLLGLVVAACHPHLPSNKIKMLDTLLNETEDTFREAVDDGLLVPEFTEWTEEQLTLRLKEKTCTFRARAYGATTLIQDYAEFLRGTSRALGRICQSVKKLRAEVIISSQQGRHRLMHTSSDQPPLAPLSSPTTQHHSVPTHPAMIPRPHSCPPALPTLNARNDISGSLGRARIPPSDPFADSSRSDSDVPAVGA